MSYDPKEAAAKRAVRFAKMSDKEIAAEKAKYEDDLNRMTGGRGDEACLKANSIRFLWTEQLRRGAAGG